MTFDCSYAAVRDAKVEIKCAEIISPEDCSEYFTDSYGDEVSKAAVKALGHLFGDWIIVKEPGKTQKGEERRTCSRCGKVETREIPALEPSATLKGDLDFDGKVDSTDYIIMKRFILKITVLSDDALIAADMDDSGNIDSTDIIILKKVLLGLIIL